MGYVHKDLKGSNLLFSRQGPADGKVFLVDYGLVSKLTRYKFANFFNIEVNVITKIVEGHAFANYVSLIYGTY
jgi:serine/threonine protein kinase